jgi:anthranilate synthase/aminodeoxychorismate synthase-like glutamine amidotransferase
LVVDNVDSFTHNLLHALGRNGLTCELVRHDAASATELAARDWSGLVIGPGPCSPHEAGVTLPLLDLLTKRSDGRPVLGICLGHQAIAIAAGGRVARARRAVHGETVTLRHDGCGCLEGLPEAPQVVRYNSLGVEEEALPSSLEPCAWDEHGDLMALRHRTLPHEGVQFHPEAWLGTDGLVVLRSWAARLHAACGSRSRRAG